jgi:hypothetical protein
MYSLKQLASDIVVTDDILWNQLINSKIIIDLADTTFGFNVDNENELAALIRMNIPRVSIHGLSNLRLPYIKYLNLFDCYNVRVSCDYLYVEDCVNVCVSCNDFEMKNCAMFELLIK